ncbi:hypothetical protein FRUB_01368 [Fimbriiglobus ruber]|uniref:Uncharacterized protein n=1 Tax=Fimbriiglobus ruber TaxID=1908690 RepID=A0A225E9D5_9BACT|nr:hypothetical protein FRUB_01368 [Fimbriiglobus ruber]
MSVSFMVVRAADDWARAGKRGLLVELITDVAHLKGPGRGD